MSQKQYAYFSAAIRDGARLRSQARTAVGGFPGQLRLGITCAIGAGIEAMFGLGALNDGCAGSNVYSTFPYLLTAARCSACARKASDDLYRTIIHLNDHHRWTREAIADWLYEQEELLGFVTVVETEALNIPEAGRGDSVVTGAQAGVLTERF